MKRKAISIVAVMIFMTACSFPLFAAQEEAQIPGASPESSETSDLHPTLDEQPVEITPGATTPLEEFPAVSAPFPQECPAYPDDFSFVRVPDPLSGDNPLYPLSALDEPAAGDCFADPTFGTVMHRVTEIDGINGRHEYSRFDPYNADQSMIILIHSSGSYMIYRTDSLPYNQPDNFVMEITSTEPRWDPLDPGVIWAFQDFAIVQIRPAIQETSVVKDFSQDNTLGPIIAEGTTYRITMMDEGEASYDKRFWAFSLQGNDRVDYRHQYFFTWERDSDTVLGVYPSGRPLEANESEIDWISMSPLGNWVLIGGMETNIGDTAGLTMASLDFSQFHRLDYITSHADIGLDSEGNEVVVMQNYNTDYIDLIPIDLETQPILEAGGSYEGSNHIPLIRLYYASDDPHGLNSGVHISCNTPGYCFISTTIAPDLPEQNWLDRSLLLVRLDRQDPGVYYLAKLHNTTAQEPRVYWDETHGTMTNTGNYLVWSDNWGLRLGEEALFMMQIILPENWKQLTGGE